MGRLEGCDSEEGLCGLIMTSKILLFVSCCVWFVYAFVGSSGMRWDVFCDGWSRDMFACRRGAG